MIPAEGFGFPRKLRQKLPQNAYVLIGRVVVERRVLRKERRGYGASNVVLLIRRNVLKTLGHGA